MTTATSERVAVVGSRYFRDEARRRGVACVVHRADWSTHGRSAGVIRNGVIVADCDRVVAFWDGASRGTADTITRARKAGKSVYVVLEAVVEADGSARGIGDGERR